MQYILLMICSTEDVYLKLILKLIFKLKLELLFAVSFNKNKYNYLARSKISTKRQRLSLLNGLVSIIRTRSPMLAVLPSS